MSTENRIPKPQDLTDAEAESLLRDLTSTKDKRRTLVDVLLEILGPHEVPPLDALDALVRKWMEKKAKTK